MEIRNHPEVLGISGWCRKPAVIVSSYEEACEIPEDDLFVVTQTTIREQMLRRCTAGTQRSRARSITVNNTICNATSKRQESCEKLARESDLMIVVGGRNSSNTKKLYEISKKNCTNSYFVENIEDLPLKEVRKM